MFDCKMLRMADIEAILMNKINVNHFSSSRQKSLAGKLLLQATTLLMTTFRGTLWNL